MLQTQPWVLAIGESHAQKGSEDVASTTQRFTESFLPMLTDRGTDLVLELWVAEGACGTEERTVAKQQTEVTKTQAKTNTNEFVLLAQRAKQLGLVPHVLRPSCEQYQEIANAGQDAPLRMLTLITRLTAAKIRWLMAERAKQPVEDRPAGGPLIVAYGGAMHNDVAPRPDRAQWSFGPELEQATQGRYVELDLIVPEFIRDTDSWKSQRWYADYDPQAHPDETTLMQLGKDSYALFFARSPTPGPTAQ